MSWYSAESPARLLIADQGPLRNRVRAFLADAEELVICAEAEDAQSAIVEARRTQPDLSMVGWDIPGGGVTAVRGVFEAAPKCAVVVLASTSNVDDLLDSLRAGAVGYVPGAARSAGLRHVVRAALSQEAVVPRSMVRDLILELRAITLGTGAMTSREAQVLGMLRRGRSTAEIAARLSMSPVTVRRHISDLVHKLGVADRAALIHLEHERQTPPGPSNGG